MMDIWRRLTSVVKIKSMVNHMAKRSTIHICINLIKMISNMIQMSLIARERPWSNTGARSMRLIRILMSWPADSIMDSNSIKHQSIIMEMKDMMRMALRTTRVLSWVMPTMGMLNRMSLRKTIQLNTLMMAMVVQLSSSKELLLLNLRTIIIIILILMMMGLLQLRSSICQEVGLVS